MKNSIHWILKGILFMAWLALQACVSSQGLDARPFLKVPKFGDLSGIYQNQSDMSDPKVPAIQLSAIWWPDMTKPEHAQIQSIQLSVLNERSLKVMAWSGDGQLVNSAVLNLGQHFEFHDGQLKASSKSQAAGLSSGEPLVGLAKTSMVMGLDEAGHARVRQTLSATGMGFGIIPMHISGETEFRFLRVQ
jgi:hypothetical protein